MSSHASGEQHSEQFPLPYDLRPDLDGRVALTTLSGPADALGRRQMALGDNRRPARPHRSPGRYQRAGEGVGVLWRGGLWMCADTGRTGEIIYWGYTHYMMGKETEMDVGYT